MSNAAMIKSSKRMEPKQHKNKREVIARNFENTLLMPFADNEIRTLVSELEDIRKKYENVINENCEIERKLSVFETIIRSLRRIDKEQMKLAR